MDRDTLKSNIKTVKELVLDERKLVTYISLSKELCIHVNEAKSLLNHVVQDIKKSKPEKNVLVCFTISGLSNTNGACTRVCSETDLEAVRKSLKVIFYEHIYCVSLGVQAVDNVALTAIIKFEDFPLCTGLIKANACIKRNDDEIGTLKSRSNSAVITESKSNVIKKTTTEKPKEVVKNGDDNIRKLFEAKSEPVTRSKTPSPKKDGFTNNKTSLKKNGNKPAAKGIAGFFTKTNGGTNITKNVKVKEEKKVDEVDIKVNKEEKVAPHIHNELIKTEKISPIKTEKHEQNNKSMEKASNNSLKQIKKNAKVDKKRKRVLHVSDSESETETNDPFVDDEDNKMAVDHDSEDEIPSTPLTNTVKITSGIVNPKKRRKIVDKTYSDEDGYILTKKEEVYESCSDNEEEVKSNIKQEKVNIEKVTQIKTETSPKENGKTKRKKVSPPQKGKQQMLTNFFKKV